MSPTVSSSLASFSVGISRPHRRKNKTLGAIFRQGNTLALLEQNYAVWQVGGGANAGELWMVSWGVDVCLLGTARLEQNYAVWQVGAKLEKPSRI